MLKKLTKEQQAKLNKWLKAVKPYYLWFFGPILVLYGLDFLGLVITLAFGAVLAGFLLLCCAFLGGVCLSVMAQLPNGQDFTPVFKVRLAKMIPPFEWGYDLTTWLLAEEKKK